MGQRLRKRELARLLVGLSLVLFGVFGSGCDNEEADRADRLRPAAVESSAQPASKTRPSPSANELELTELARPSAHYRVFNRRQGQRLKLYPTPKKQDHEVGALAAQKKGVALTGAWHRQGSGLWVQVQLDDKQAWTERRYLIEHPPENACSDAQLDPLLESFIEAVQNENGPGLFRLTSPSRELLFRSYASDTTLYIDRGEIEELFDTKAHRNWMMYQDAAAAPFRRAVLPELQKTFVSGYLRNCNEAPVPLPSELQGLTLVSSRLGTGRSTWVLGVEHVGGRPYVALLYHGQ